MTNDLKGYKKWQEKTVLLWENQTNNNFSEEDA